MTTQKTITVLTAESTSVSVSYHARSRDEAVTAVAFALLQIPGSQPIIGGVDGSHWIDVADSPEDATLEYTTFLPHDLSATDRAAICAEAIARAGEATA